NNNIKLSANIVGMRDGTQSGSLEKLGVEDLSILGRLYVSNYSKFIVSQGRLLLGNRTVEGFGQLDVEVRSNAVLGGGSVDGTAGRIPGTVTIAAGGVFDPGNSPFGIMTVFGDHGDIDFQANSIFRADLGGTIPGLLHDQIHLVGALQLGDQTGLP